MSNHESYRGLPTLAGLATLEEAARPGLGIEACVARLKRYHYAFQRLHQILTARITAEPIYELKTAFPPSTPPWHVTAPTPTRWPMHRRSESAASPASKSPT